MKLGEVRSCVCALVIPAPSFKLLSDCRVKSRYKELFCSQHFMISWGHLEKTAWIHSQVNSNIRFCKVSSSASSCPFLVLRSAAQVTDLLPGGGVAWKWKYHGKLSDKLDADTRYRKVIFSPPSSSGEATSGEQCQTQGCPVQGRFWQTQARQALGSKAQRLVLLWAGDGTR